MILTRIAESRWPTPQRSGRDKQPSLPYILMVIEDTLFSHDGRARTRLAKLELEQKEEQRPTFRRSIKSCDAMDDDQQRIDAIRNEVVRRFGVEPARVRVVVSPYRICPLGAHIDHQLGPVTAMAIDQNVLLAFAPVDSREVRVESVDFPGTVAFSLEDVPPRRDQEWGNFPRGAAIALCRKFDIRRGLVGVTTGRLHGGGLSSSAAVGIAFLLAFEAVNGLIVSPEVNIELDRLIENDYLGLRNGILDQAAILLSKRGFLTRIDCATSHYERIAAPPSMPPFRLLLVFSGVEQALVGTDYNRRVDECASAARSLLEAAGCLHEPSVLARVSAADYAAHKRVLVGAPARRAAHFFSEVERVGQGIEAWKRGDLAEFGALMTASGSSSIHNYECGSPPLIDLYQILVETDGVYGARFSGAGFRGCCVALVDPTRAARIAAEVLERYRARHPDLERAASSVLCDPDHGARIVDHGAMP